jgi:hypothetical protein
MAVGIDDGHSHASRLGVSQLMRVSFAKKIGGIIGQ